MARITMARGMRREAFLPDVLKAFMRRRAVEGGGIVLFLLAAALAVALITYNHRDPTFNVANNLPPTNAIGRPGASIADILLQTLGLAGGLPALALLTWGWRITTHRGLPRWWLNISLLPLALLLAAGTFALFPTWTSWPLRGGMGGWIGDFLLQQATRFGAANGLPYGELIPAMLFAAFGAVILVYALGLSPNEWRMLGKGTAKGLGTGVGYTAAGLYHGGRAIGDLGGRASDSFSAIRDRLGRREPRLVGTPEAEEVDDQPQLRRTRGATPRAERTMEAPADKRVAKRQEKPKAGKRAGAEAQPNLALGNADEFVLPELSLLVSPPSDRKGETINEEALEQNARLLESTLGEFGVQGEIVKVRPGPVVTLYELEPAPGTKSSRVIGLADDVSRSMSALSARIAVIPGRNAIGIELPNAKRETVYLRELLSSAEYENNPSKLALALGKDISGSPVIADLSRMPHLLVAGTTGSGKSVAINTMILSLLYRLSPDQCRFIMVDPKMLELSVYDGIPHLLAPVVTESGKAVVALKWTVREMEERYRKMSELGVRNIAGYNQRLSEAKAKGEKLGRTVQTGFDPATGKPIFEERPLDLNPLPMIVVIVDELADLMIVAGKDIEAAIQRLAQMARAAGIHLIVATQRPSVDVITGTIKANFPTRISFQVTSKIDSRTILGEQGAEQLLGMGDMLFMPGAGRIQRVHGPFVSDEEVEKVVAMLKAQGEPDYLEAVTTEPESKFGMPGGGDGEGGESDRLYDQAVALVCREGKASTSFVQRHLQIGYNRAARIIERMESEGVVSQANHVGKREVLARNIEDTGT